MTSKTRKARATLVVWLIVTLLPSLLAAQAPSTVDKETYNSIQDRLICQCGCNYGLRHCPHLQCPSAPVMRASIQEKLAAGLSEPQVLEAMVAELGPAVLAAPPTEGFNLTAWVMPFVALLLGLWLAVVVVRKWTRRQPQEAADPAVVDRYRDLAEREMKHLEE